MKGLLAVLSSSFLMLQTQALQAQTDAFQEQQADLRFTYYNTAQGLSANFVYAITQDPRGFMWIGTHDGLNMFDGYRFTVFRHDPSNPHSLPGNTVTDVCADDYGQIWLVAGNQLGFLDVHKKQFTRVMSIAPTAPAHPLLMATREILLVESRRPKWINTRTKEAGFIAFKHPEYSGEQWPDCSFVFARSRSGDTYAMTSDHHSGKFFRLDTLAKAFVFLGELDFPEPWGGPMPMNALMVDEAGQAHIALPNALPASFPAARPPATIPVKPSGLQVADFLEDGVGDTWIATSQGLGYRKRAAEKIHWYGQGENASGLRSGVIRDCYQDRSGMIWIGTANGLHLFNPQQVNFRHIRAADKGHGLLSDFVLGLMSRTDGSVRVDYFNVDRYSVVSPGGGMITHHAVDRQDFREMVREKILRMGGRMPGQMMIDQVAGYLKKIGHVNLRRIEGIHWDNRDAAWLILSSRLEHVPTGRVYPLPAEPQDVKSMGDSILLAVPGKGLMIFNARSGDFMQPIEKNLVGSDEVTALLVRSGGALCMGTKGGGLVNFRTLNSSPVRYTTNEGLATNTVYSLVEDKSGGLWIGTSAGVSCLDGKGAIRNFFPHHGFRNLEFNRHSSCMLPDGTILLGGMDGVDIFHPDVLLRKKQLPNVCMTDLRVYNVTRPVSDSLRLRHNENQLSFEFAVLDFAQPERNRFQYMLEGVDTNWMDHAGNHMATYSHLKPGQYRFLVRGSDSDGNWNPDPAIVFLEILPAWYQTWWFYGLLGAMAGLLIYLLFNYRLQQKLQLFHTRQRIHRDLHDDVGATLSSVKAYSEILKANPDNPVIPELISENASEMIDRLDVISWATNPEHDNLGSLKSRMVKFAAPLCHARQITFELDLDGLQETELIPGEIRQQLLMVFKEAVNNLVKYSGASVCKVLIYVRGRQFFMEVSDNGRGTDGTVLGQGNGWKNMRERALQLGGEIRFESQLLRGTRVILWLPYPLRIPYSWGRNGR